jgi:RecA-family ATPase
VTSAELDAAEFNIEYLIDRTLVAGQPCIVAGGKKTLKTSLILDLGISLSIGGFFLGKLKVNRACRVGIMSGESGMPVLQETARRIARAAGYSLSDLSGIVWSDELPRFGNVEHAGALREFIMGDELEVLFVDPAYKCMPGADASNLFL